MGRCNNRRTRQQAEENKNTAARARFSKGPPKKPSNGRGSGSGRGNAADTTKASVVEKIVKRVEEKKVQGTTPSVLTTRKSHPLDSVDVSKLDEIILSDDSIVLVTRLLQDLNVMESERLSKIIDVSENDDDVYEVVSGEGVQDGRACDSGGYTEYDDDNENFDDDCERISADREPSQISGEEEVMNSPLFLHLTVKLSFSKAQALKTCRGLQNWNTAADSDNLLSLTSERLTLAMDWLCLHLTDEELNKGFQINPSSVAKRSSTGILLVGSGRTRAIPHESISLAKPLTSDTEWREAARLESRKLGFIRLGFASIECDQAFSQVPDSSVKNAEDDEAALRIMLEVLEVDALKNERQTLATTATRADLAFAKEEQDQEFLALEAIFECSFQRKKSTHALGRCMIKVTPMDTLQCPGNSDSCWLHVFPREGYPLIASPLLLFSNPTLPPSLLRRINCCLAMQANQLVGEPAIFSLVDFLSSTVRKFQTEFVQEQHAKEMETDQLRMHSDVHAVDKSIGANGGRRQTSKEKGIERGLSRTTDLIVETEERRRQQEKILARIESEKLKFRPAFAERAIAKRNQDRIGEEAENAARFAMNKAFNEGKSVEDARGAARRARTESLRHNGVEVPFSDVTTKSLPASESATESTAPPAAVRETSRDEDSPRRTREKEVQAHVGSVTMKATSATTLAFMERLRESYMKTASLNGKRGDDGTESSATSSRIEIVLRDPTSSSSKEINDNCASLHVPDPIPIPTGDLRKLMKDVIELQREQPWLVSGEARVPNDAAGASDLTINQRKQRNEMSKRLRIDLERKYQEADKIGEQNQDDTRRGQIAPAAEKFHRMLCQRRRLPTFQMRDEIIRVVNENQICVVSGDTGCGKTTQVPQLILDDLIWSGRGAEANMIVTQPRRISAIGVAERVSAERCEKVGETTGYSIRLENKRSSKTRILLCTTGILLRRLQCDPDLASISHIFVDEVHERDLNTDFLLIILKDLLARRKSLKLVLMSATLNADAFSSYFGGCPVVSIPGRTHPVTEYRLEDVLMLTGYDVRPGSDYALKTSMGKSQLPSKSKLRQLYHPKYPSSVINSLETVDESVINYELLAALLEHIGSGSEEGAILVFLPGMAEITKAIETLYKTPLFQSSKVVIYPLHSSLSTAEQTSVFDVPPIGVRKIVVSTNIAETSITIEDVVFVVDCGRVKENRKDELNEMPTLVETWVSRASAKQRRGRAGRVRPGISYHMFSSHTFQNDMQEYQMPEMLRVGLEDLVLQILVLDLGEPSSFLAKAVNPPSALALKNSLKLLEGLGAVVIQWNTEDSIDMKRDDNESSCVDVAATSGLTALGFHLATLPVDPRVGKMMIYGALFGCTDPALTIAASMSARSPFMSPFDKRDKADEARQLFATEGSDPLTTMTAFDQWKEFRRANGDRATNDFLRDSFLSRLTLFQIEDLRKQFANLLVEIGFLPKGFKLIEHRSRGIGGRVVSQSTNVNSENVALIKTIVCAGLYPNIIVAPRNLVDVRPGDKAAGECAFRSLKGDVYLHPCTISFKAKLLDSRYCCYQEIVKTSKIYVRDCTTVSPIALLLFGGSLEVFHTKHIVTVDKWLQFRIGARPATLVKHLRAQMESLLLRKILSPHDDVTGSKEGQALIRAVSTLLANEKLPIFRVGAEIARPWVVDSDRGGRGRSDGGRGGRGRKSYSRGRGRSQRNR